MLEHQKIVLKNVSADKKLFKKELIKSLRWLDPVEIALLSDWVNQEFSDKHSDIISEIFANTAA